MTGSLAARPATAGDAEVIAEFNSRLARETEARELAPPGDH